MVSGVRLRISALLVPICMVLAGCGGTGNATGLARDWGRRADGLCQKHSAAYRRDWSELERRTARGEEPKTALIWFYSHAAAQQQAMTDALRADVHAQPGSLPSALLESSAMTAEGLRQQAAATRSGDAARMRQADVKVTDGTVPFLLLASVARLRSCADDGETAASSTPEQRVAFQASSDATWMCVTHGEQVPPTYRSIIEADLRSLATMAKATPRTRVRFIAHFHPSFTYRALAHDAATALGANGCADDPTLGSIRTQLDPGQASSA
jgi:hypothetical protein